MDNSILLDGYDFFRCDRDTGKGGGVLFFYKNTLPSNLLEKVNINSKIEALLLEILFNNNKLNILLVYRSPSSIKADDKIFVETLEKYLKLDMNLIVVGDFNLPKTDWNKLLLSRKDKISSYFQELCLSQIVKIPTRKNNILDLIFINKDLIKINYKIINILPSKDHKQIEFEIEDVAKIQKIINEDKKYYNYIDYKRLAKLSKLDGNCVFVNWSNLINVLKDLISESSITKPIITLNDRLAKLREKEESINYSSSTLS